MGRLSKIKRQLIEQANKRLLGEQYDEFGQARKQAWELNDEGDKGGYAGTFGSDDNTFPWINKKNQHNPSMEHYEDEEETFDTFDDWKASSYYNDPDSNWDINRVGHDDSNKNYFDIHKEKYGPFRVKKLRQQDDEFDDVESGFGDVSVMSNRNYRGEDLYGLPGPHISDEEAEEMVNQGSMTQAELDTWRERKDWSEEESKSWKDSQGGLEMDDIVSSLRDQLTKATGKTFSPEQIAAKLKELKDEEMSRREDI